MSDTKRWWSSHCRCSIQVAERIRITPCDYEHCIWVGTIAPGIVRDIRASHLKRGLEIEKVIRRGYGDSFVSLLERYERVARCAGVFFREPIPCGIDSNITAGMSMFIKESFGGELRDCDDPELLATYLQGKSILGLNEKMWLESYHWPEGRLLQPEELVLDGLLGFAAAEAMFGRALDADLLQVAGFNDLEREAQP